MVKNLKTQVGTVLGLFFILTGIIRFALFSSSYIAIPLLVWGVLYLSTVPMHSFGKLLQIILATLYGMYTIYENVGHSSTATIVLVVTILLYSRYFLLTWWGITFILIGYLFAMLLASWTLPQVFLTFSVFVALGTVVTILLNNPVYKK